MEGVGVPYGLKQLIAMKTADRSKPGVQSGVPRFFDNQLHEWIYNSRIANIEINQKELQIAIKGDEEEYPIKWWMFCKTKINNFNLVATRK
jgi:hypothetical protein